MKLVVFGGIWGFIVLGSFERWVIDSIFRELKGCGFCILVFVGYWSRVVRGSGGSYVWW